MTAFEVIKSIEFCYGHRLHGYHGPCCHLHGHNATVEITVGTDRLGPHGLACDFREIKRVIKGWIDTNLDHRMLLQASDPLVPMLRAHDEPLFVMQEPPSAENIAKCIYQCAQSEGFAVTKVRLWESNSSCAVYRGT